MTTNEARNFLKAAGVFFEADEDEDPKWDQTINLNDTWMWACAAAEYVSDEELPEVARLFWHYGWCGILYWASEKNDHCQTEFSDNNRFIEFVRKEEVIRAEEPSSTKRAYMKRRYEIGCLI